MPFVGRFLGPVLGPRKKMPKPVPASAKPEPLIERLKNTAKVRIKDQPVIQAIVGTQDMDDELIADNIEAVLDILDRKLEKGRKQIKSMYVKDNHGSSSEGDLMPHVAEWKKDEVASLKKLIESHEVVGMANLSDIPAPQLQKMRRTLKDSATLKMSRKTLMSLALNNCDKENITTLEKHMDGQPALIFTNMNPFKLYKILEGSKTAAPAKAGSIAPEDIVVPKGDTALNPAQFLVSFRKLVFLQR